jgi:hypothetical protein
MDRPGGGDEIFLHFFRQLSGRPLVPFDDEAEALRWLVEQP